MELLTHKKNASIDLLKDEAQVNSNSQKKLVVSSFVLLLLIVMTITFGLFFFNLAQKFRLNNIKDDLASKITAWQALEAVGTQVKTIEAKNQVITSTNTKYGDLDKKLNKVRELLPQGTSLSTLTINNSGKTVISGKATEAAVVYQFYEVLKKDPEVSLVTLDSLSKASSDYTFNISLTVTPK